jgi:hypothetical protein
MLRSWSLLKEPPRLDGERRLAIERERFPVESIDSKHFEEEAFGSGRVIVWDEGEVKVKIVSSRVLALAFTGSKITGTYEFRRMLWYPGNRWIFTKLRIPKAPPHRQQHPNDSSSKLP